MEYEDFMEKLGYAKERCPYCKAHMYQDKHGLICLNGCTLSGWAYRKMVTWNPDSQDRAIEPDEKGRGRHAPPIGGRGGGDE